MIDGRRSNSVSDREGRDQRDQVPEAAPEPIMAPDHARVAGTEVPQAGVQLRTLAEPSWVSWAIVPEPRRATPAATLIREGCSRNAPQASLTTSHWRARC